MQSSLLPYVSKTLHLRWITIFQKDWSPGGHSDRLPQKKIQGGPVRKEVLLEGGAALADPVHQKANNPLAEGRFIGQGNVALERHQSNAQQWYGIQISLFLRTFFKLVKQLTAEELGSLRWVLQLYLTSNILFFPTMFEPLQRHFKHLPPQSILFPRFSIVHMRIPWEGMKWRGNLTQTSNFTKSDDLVKIKPHAVADRT